MAILEHASWIPRVFFWYFIFVGAAVSLFYLVLAPLGVAISILIPPTVRVYKDFIAFEKPSLVIKFEDITRLVLRIEKGGKRFLTVESSTARRRVSVPSRIDPEQLRLVLGNTLEVVQEH